MAAVTAQPATRVWAAACALDPASHFHTLSAARHSSHAEWGQPGALDQ